MKAFELSLYLVLDPNLCRSRSLVETARAAVAGGVTMVQLRDKIAGTTGLVAAGRALMDALAGTGVPLIVNDDLDAALTINADGLHVGQDDMPADEARHRLGRGKILGLSVETEAAAQAVDPSVVDYVGIGPVFATPTKPDHKPPIGLDGLTRIVATSAVPAVAIGGLKAAHVPSILASGAYGLAVVSAICGQPDPKAAAHALRMAIGNERSGKQFRRGRR
ncbi:thiamine phosphate synthase [Jiella sp. MQZ9-1]|uniref:Thiamine-phosphate synthase n=1 Tax=Jiella flava TaxID=2816857 RepID=A0A939G2L3_9HYPH|nr:thiamine phosphate synthase [Jiella flava]MBO0664571.1 thiamine phosphate synthase [Jiella flava]MCD2473204.1 thiamine phosphate synthase [Jiella flava]